MPFVIGGLVLVDFAMCGKSFLVCSRLSHWFTLMLRYKKKEMPVASPFNSIINFLHESQDSVLLVASVKVQPPSSALHFQPQ